MFGRGKGEKWRLNKFILCFEERGEGRNKHHFSFLYIYVSVTNSYQVNQIITQF